MIPFVRFAFHWSEANEDYFTLIDHNGVFGSNHPHGSTISETTVKQLGLPIVRTAEDEERLIETANYLHSYRRV